MSKKEVAALLVLVAAATWACWTALTMHTVLGELRALNATRDHTLRIQEPVKVKAMSKLLRYTKLLANGTTIEFECDWDCTPEGLQECKRLWEMVCEAHGG